MPRPANSSATSSVRRNSGWRQRLRAAWIRRCIIDKDVEVPSGVEVGFNLEADRQRFFVTENGLVVIPKRAKLDDDKMWRL